MSSQAQLEINDNESIPLPTLPTLELPYDDIDNDLDGAAATDDNQANTSASTLPPIDKTSGDDTHTIVAEQASDQIDGEIKTTSIGNNTYANTANISNSQGTNNLKLHHNHLNQQQHQQKRGETITKNATSNPFIPRYALHYASNYWHGTPTSNPPTTTRHGIGGGW